MERLGTTPEVNVTTLVNAMRRGHDSLRMVYRDQDGCEVSIREREHLISVDYDQEWDTLFVRVARNYKLTCDHGFVILFGQVLDHGNGVVCDRPTSARI